MEIPEFSVSMQNLNQLTQSFSKVVTEFFNSEAEALEEFAYQCNEAYDHGYKQIFKVMKENGGREEHFSNGYNTVMLSLNIKY